MPGNPAFPRNTPDEVAKMQRIIRESVDYLGITMEEFRSGSTAARHSEKRSIVLYLAATHTRCTLARIAEEWGCGQEPSVSSRVTMVRRTVLRGHNKWIARNVEAMERALGLAPEKAAQ